MSTYSGTSTRDGGASCTKLTRPRFSGYVSRKAGKSPESLGQTLRVIEAVDTDDAEAIQQHSCHAARVSLCLFRDREARNLCRVDADGKDRGLHLPPVGMCATLRVNVAPCLVADVLVEAAPIRLGLEAEHVVGEQRPDEHVVHRQRVSTSGEGKGMCRKKPIVCRAPMRRSSSPKAIR